MRHKQDRESNNKTKRGDLSSRRVMGRIRPEAAFPVPPAISELPSGYAELLLNLKQRISQERIRVVLSANAAMVLLYWDIGQTILQQQAAEGWGTKVIDRLAADLSDTFPEMKGLSSRNLKYMRAFAEAWPNREFVQEPLAQITWYHNLALLEKLSDSESRLWYARKAIEQGWSRNILVLQIDQRLHERQGNLISNFTTTMPPMDSDMAA